MFTRSLIALLLFSTLGFAKTPELSPADSHLKKLQASWDKLKSLEADFTQSVYSKAIEGMPPDVTNGKLYLLRPNRLRWESETDGSFQILDRDQLTVVRKNQRGTTLVDIYEKVRKSVGAKPLNFLTGGARFTSLYRPELVNETDDSVTLKLVPKDPVAETYIAEINKDGYFLQSLATDTEDTKVVMKFTNVKRNAPVDKALFAYKPKSTDIVHRQ